MDNTTTDVDGGAQASQPTETTEAVTEGHNDDQVIVQDENGTPSLAPATSQQNDQPSDEAVSDEPAAADEPVTQADDVAEWAKKKGLPMDDPVKLAQMYRDAEKKMHEATEAAKILETTSQLQAPLEPTGNEEYDSLAQSVNNLLIKNNVNDFFSQNPQAREFETKMAEIVIARPHLKNDLDALYALARNDPNRENELKREGGREALTNLAQKQQAIPPSANATNSGVYESAQITPQNVYDLVDKNDQKWFEKNHEAISNAMMGK